MNSDYLETNERVEYLDSLSSLSDFLKKTVSHTYYWKWSFIALHLTIQNAMVVALRRTDGLGPFNEKEERKFLKSIEETGTHDILPDFLMKFPSILRHNVIGFAWIMKFLMRI